MEAVNALHTTPLIEEHRKLGAKLAPFGGWLMPIQYSGIIEEHNWTRTHAGLFDICHMGEFIVEASLDSCNLDELVTINLNKMAPGSCRYGFTLNESGGIIDDLVVYRIASDRWMIVVNAATTDNDEAHIRKYLSGKFNLNNVSGSLGKLDLQGPESAGVARRFAGTGIDNLKYYSFGYFTVLGEKIIVSRTGYTGELGYEFYMPNMKILKLWNELLSDAKVKPVGLGARDTLRLEMGYGLYGQDMNDKTSPLEAGLGSFIDWDKNFIGKPALLKQKTDGISRHMISFIADSRRSPRHNYRILYKSKDIGVVTSGSFSPSLGCGIGMGYVSSPLTAGEDIVLTEGAIAISAKIAKKPFYKKGTAKISKDYTDFRSRLHR